MDCSFTVPYSVVVRYSFFFPVIQKNVNENLYLIVIAAIYYDLYYVIVKFTVIVSIFFFFG